MCCIDWNCWFKEIILGVYVMFGMDSNDIIKFEIRYLSENKILKIDCFVKFCLWYCYCVFKFNF